MNVQSDNLALGAIAITQSKSGSWELVHFFVDRHHYQVIVEIIAVEFRPMDSDYIRIYTQHSVR